MNLTGRIKNRENLDPIELFDISDTKEIINDNYNSLVNEINQMQTEEQIRVNEYNKKFEIALNNAKDKDNKNRLKTRIFFCILLLFIFSLISIILLSYYLSDDTLIGISLIFAFIIILLFLGIPNKQYYQKKVSNKFKKEKNIGSIQNKINFYRILFKELNEIYKLFNNPELKQNEIIANLIALKTNYESRKFQQEMLNKKDMENEIQRQIAEYNKKQLESQHRQEQSQYRQEEYVRLQALQSQNKQ